MNLLHTADVQTLLGISRRAAQKFLREIGAERGRDAQGREDYTTSHSALEAGLTIRSLIKLSGEMPLDPLRKAAVEMALAAQLQHAGELAALRTSDQPDQPQPAAA